MNQSPVPTSTIKTKQFQVTTAVASNSKTCLQLIQLMEMVVNPLAWEVWAARYLDHQYEPDKYYRIINLKPSSHFHPPLSGTQVQVQTSFKPLLDEPRIRGYFTKTSKPVTSTIKQFSYNQCVLLWQKVSLPILWVLFFPLLSLWIENTTETEILWVPQYRSQGIYTGIQTWHLNKTVIYLSTAIYFLEVTEELVNSEKGLMAIDAGNIST